MRRRPADPTWVPERGWLRPDRAGPDAGVSGRFLTMATVLAVAVRFYHLGSQSLWVDEAMTWNMARPDGGLSFAQQVGEEIQGPLYLALVWPLVRWAGFSEFWLRFPAAVAGALTVPLLALLGQRLCNGRSARLAALLLAVNPFHLWYSQEARGYAFLMLLATLASLAFLWLASRPSVGRALLYGGLGLATALSNFSGLFLLMGHALAVPVVVRPRGSRAWGAWLGAWLLIAVVLAPWLLRASDILAVDRLLPGAAGGTPLRGETTFSVFALPYTVYAFFFGFSLGPSLTELHGPGPLAAVRAWWPVLGGAALAILVPLVAGALRLGRRGMVLLALWVLVPAAAVTLLAARNFKPFNPRYLAAVMPLVLLVAAHGLGSLPRRLGRICGFVMLALLLWSLHGYHGDPRYAKEDVRDAAAWIAGRADASDPIMVPVVTHVYHLYHAGPGRIVPFWQVPLLRDEAAARAVLRERMGDAPKGYLVLARSWEIDPDGRLPAALMAEATIAAEAVFPGVRVLEWRRTPRASEERP